MKSKLKYRFLDISETYNYTRTVLSTEEKVYELFISPNIQRMPCGFNKKYTINIEHLDEEEHLFETDSKYELKIWMDLNGFNYQNCKIFYTPKHKIEYASFLLRKED